MSDLGSETYIGIDEGFEDVAQEANERRLALAQRRIKVASSILASLSELRIDLRPLPADTARMHLEMASRELVAYIAELP